MRTYINWVVPTSLSILLLGLCLPAEGDIIVEYQPGPVGGKDANVRYYGGTVDDTYNYGVNADLRVRAHPAVRYHGFIEFDLDDFSYEADDIQSVKLSLKSCYSYNGAKSGNVGISVYQVTENWIEGVEDGAVPTDGGVTYNNQPSYNSTAKATITVPSTITSGQAAGGGVWHGWDSTALTDLVKGWVAGTTSNYGLMVRFTAPDDTTYQPYHIYRLSDYTGGDSDRPKLEITVIPEPGSICLLLSGVAAIAATCWFRRRRSAK